ncbi:MAG: hypothetical protein Kow0029_31310 [Candidatus Rifleibacteriota bacterium]
MKKIWFNFFCVLMVLSLAVMPAFSQQQDSAENGQNVAYDDDEKQAVTNDSEQQQDSAATGQQTDAAVDQTQTANQSSDDKTPETSTKKNIVSSIQKLRAQIKKLIRQRFFAKAEGLIKEVKEIIRSQENKKRMSAQLASIERNEVVALHQAQGEYQQAANAIRNAIKLNENKNDVKQLMRLQKKAGIQKKWFGTRLAHEKKLHELLESKQPLLKEKLAILSKIDTKSKLSEDQLKNLQAELKKINAKLARVNKQLQEERRVYAVELNKIKKQGVILNAAQHKRLFPHIMKRMMVRFENYKLHKQIARHLTNIAENTEVTWKDLQKNFASLKKLQDEIWGLRKQLDYLAGKVPLTDELRQQAEKVRNQLEKAINAAEELMEKVEKAFVDQKIFAKLTAKEKLEFVKLFREVWSQDKEFDSLKPSIKELYEKIFDSPVIVGPSPIDPIPGDPVPGKKYDLEGEGLIIMEGSKEGNFYFLKFQDKLYRANNLPARYMINNLEVKFAANFIYRIMKDSPNQTSNQASNQNIEMVGSDTKIIGNQWWLRYPEISFVYINAPQLPDEPYRRDDTLATPSQIIDEDIQNENQPSNLMNAF